MSESLDALFPGPIGGADPTIVSCPPADMHERARAYYTSVEAYTPFDHTPDGRTMLGCMDPRGDRLDSAQGLYVVRRQMTKIQGPGGELGEGDDQANARTVETGRLVSVRQGMKEDMALRRASVLGGHKSVCLYAAGYQMVVAEQADPSQQTVDYVNRWVAYHELNLAQKHFDAVVGAAALRLDHLGSGNDGIEDLIQVLDDAYPEHHNVPEMAGKANPGFYIVNNFPHLGLNRHRKHEEQRMGIHAYHDNVGARLDNVNNLHALSRPMRALRMAALLLRSAATRTVIDRLKRKEGRPVEHWDIEIGDTGPRFIRIS